MLFISLLDGSVAYLSFNTPNTPIYVSMPAAVPISSVSREQTPQERRGGLHCPPGCLPACLRESTQKEHATLGHCHRDATRMLSNAREPAVKPTHLGQLVVFIRYPNKLRRDRERAERDTDLVVCFAACCHLIYFAHAPTLCC